MGKKTNGKRNIVLSHDNIEKKIVDTTMDLNCSLEICSSSSSLSSFSSTSSSSSNNNSITVSKKNKKNAMHVARNPSEKLKLEQVPVLLIHMKKVGLWNSNSDGSLGNRLLNSKLTDM